MPTQYFHSALPDSTSIEQAVEAMIEGDSNIKLPLQYETIGLPFFERMDECLKVLDKLVESAQEFSTNNQQEAAMNCLSAFQETYRLAQLYKNDLLEYARRNDGDKIPRNYLIPWALEAHGVDIHGTNARAISTISGPVGSDDPQQQNTDAVINQLDKWAALSEGQKIFYCMACLFESVMTLYHGDWSAILADKSDETTKDFFISGRINQSAVANKIGEQLPSPLSGFGGSTTPTNHVKTMQAFLLSDSQDNPKDLSPQARPKAQVTLYALACILWVKKTGTVIPNPDKCEYPKGYLKEIVPALPTDFAFSESGLGFILDNARRDVIRQRDIAEAAPPRKK